METNIQIKAIEEKTSKAGKVYAAVETDQGKMSAFDKPIIDELKKLVGKAATVEVEESKGFKNIRKFKGAFEIATEKIGQEQKPASVQETSQAQKEKRAETLTGYAKDLAIAMNPQDFTKAMEAASDLVVKIYKNVLSNI